MVIKSINGTSISTVEEWFEHAPPAAKGLHWRDFKSAKELAKAWIRVAGKPEMPEELVGLLNSHPDTASMEINSAVAECRTELDSYGKGRMHDLLVIGSIGKEKAIVSIEAKADESFGVTIGGRRKNNSPNSNIEKRINGLANLLLGNIEIEHLRYQLLHGIAAALIEARKQEGSMAIFAVHEFVSPETKAAKQRKNANDLNAFVSCLRNTPVQLEYGTLIGPIVVPGNSQIPLYIGKVKTEVR